MPKNCRQQNYNSHFLCKKYDLWERLLFFNIAKCSIFCSLYALEKLQTFFFGFWKLCFCLLIIQSNCKFKQLFTNLFFPWWLSIFFLFVYICNLYAYFYFGLFYLSLYKITYMCICENIDKTIRNPSSLKGFYNLYWCNIIT